MSFAVSLSLCLSAKADECDFRSESFDPNVLTLDVRTFKTDVRACQLSGTGPVVSLRTFELSKKPYSWVVDQDRMITALVPQSCLEACVPFKAETAAYGRALTRATAAPQPLQDGGIKNSQSMKLQMFVTIDLCPSAKPLVREVFERLMRLSTVPGILPQFVHPAVPIALSVSGGWLQKHSEDLDYLKTLERQNRLQITWVNHTFTHPYTADLPLAHNFILKSGVNFTTEILENEKLMLQKGLVPSVFVRLPGLISDQKHMDELNAWGLIPLGADAWIAKGEKPRNGSIILIHANGNEPKGIRLFDQLLSEHDWWVKIFQNLPHVFQQKDDHE